MNTIQNLFQQAQLAEAAYANFFSDAGLLLTNKNDVKAALITEGMSDTQASAFVNTWEVVDQYISDGFSITGDNTGFSATLFRNRTKNPKVPESISS